MPTPGYQRRRDRADLLAKVPASAKRVMVETALGEQKWKELNDLDDDDVIQVNKKGEPVVMKTKPGRRAYVQVKPVNPTVAAILDRRNAALASDPILKTIQKAPESPDVLHEVIKGLAEEAGNLRHERDEAARQGKESSGLSAKRVQALRATAETWLKRMDQLSGSLIDLDSPVCTALFQLTFESMKEAMESSFLRDEMIETIFTKLGLRMNTDEWKAEAHARMKKAMG